MPRSALLIAAFATVSSARALPAQVIEVPLGNTSIAPVAPPTPEPTPSPSPSPSPIANPVATATPRPTPAPSPTARAATVPAAVLPPAPAASPSPAPSAAATPAPAVTPSPIETVVLPAPAAATASAWPWLAGAGLVAVLLIAWAALRHRRIETYNEEWPEPAADSAPPAEPAAAPDPPPPARGPKPAMFERTVPVARARLQFALRPTRAGLNLISATVEGEVTIVNVGATMAQDVRAALRLMSARGGEGAELDAFYAAVTAKPAIPPFALAPGEERRFRAVAALPHDAIQALDAGGRPMFVPLLALSVHYIDPAGEHRAGQAFAVGIERADSIKLAPLWLDTPARTYEAVAARPQGPMVEA